MLLGLALVALGGCSLGDDRTTAAPPQLGTPPTTSDAAAKLGFPSTATRNTIRVGGGDAAADAAGVASAVFPGTNERHPPDRRRARRPGRLAGRRDRRGARRQPDRRAAAVSDGGELPAVTEDTLEQPGPEGLGPLARTPRSSASATRPRAPSGFRTAVIEGKDPYERAAAIDRFFSAARGKPSPTSWSLAASRPSSRCPPPPGRRAPGDSVLLTQARPAAAGHARGDRAPREAEHLRPGPGGA